MTRRIITISVSIILIVAFLLTFSWFYVRGAELRFLQDIPADCDAGVSIWTWSFDEEATGQNEYKADLTQDQLSQVLELLQDSSYWRIPASTITYNDPTTYTVFITYKIDGTAQYISITSSGGYAINIHSSQENPFENNFLRIRDEDWVKKLDAIFLPS